MPKMKTHRGAAKRIKVSGSGKILRGQAGRGHYKLAKSNNRFRRLAGDADLKPGDAKAIKRMLGL